MAYAHFERLSALDSSFLGLEDESSHMHVGSVSIFESAPLEREGSLDVERLRQLIEGNLHKTPRYRQKLMWTLLTHHPVWVDDDRFNFTYHFRHVSLPPPGEERQLKRLAGRIMSQKLDRHKPLWELWLVEGLTGGRCAVINKVHHCMIDGVSSAEMLAETMTTSPDGTLPEPHPFVPRPAPSPARLLGTEIERRASESLSLVGDMGRAVGRPRDSLRSLRDSTEAIAEVVRAGLRPASATPLNCAIGPHRRFDWLRMPLAEIKEIKNELGGTINDVVLALASGALRRFLLRRGARIEGLDFRAMLPVNVRGPEDAGYGNRVAMMVARLPLEVVEPAERLAAVTEITTELKQSHQAEGVDTIEQVGDFVAPNLMIQIARLAARARPFNMTITNVPGPQHTLYMLGAPLREVYGLVPLYRDQALGMGLFSYDGGLFWGLNADWDAVPDLHDVVDALVLEFDALRKRTAPTAQSRPTRQ
jgi:diacylglycerol O-acyltransferase